MYDLIDNPRSTQGKRPLILVAVGLMLCLNLQAGWNTSSMIIRDLGFYCQWLPEKILFFKTLFPFLLLLCIVLWALNIGKRKYQADQLPTLKVLLTLIVVYAFSQVFQFVYTLYVYEILFEAEVFSAQVKAYRSYCDDFSMSAPLLFQAILSLPLGLLFLNVVFLTARK